MKKTLLILCLLMASMTFNAQNLLTEGFDVFANLTAAGWISTNQSSPLGASTWAQGGGTAFSGGGTGDNIPVAKSKYVIYFNDLDGSYLMIPNQ